MTDRVRHRVNLGALALLLAVSGITVGTPPAPAGAAPVSLTLVGQSSDRYNTFSPNGGPTASFSSPAVGDVTGDGVPEIVTGGMDGCVRVLRLDASTLVGCISTNGAGIQSSPVLVDWDGDGVKDIIVASVAGGIFGWRGNGAPLFVFLTGGGVFGTPAVGDIDGDGTLDVVVASWGQYVTAYRHNGTRLFHRFIYDSSYSSPAIADLDGDGTMEVIVGGDMDFGNAANLPPYNLPPGGLLWVLRSDGTDRPGFPRHLSDQVIWSSPSIVDLDQDGNLDIVVGTGENWGGKGHTLFAINRFGNPLPGWPVAMPAPTMGSPAIADLDGDGRLDVAQQSGDGSISYIASNGAVWKRWCNRSFGPCSPLGLDGQPSIGDINGDGTQDVVAFTEAHLRVFHGGSGAQEYELPMPYTWAPGSQPTLVRYNNETYVVVTATVSGNNNLLRDAGDLQVTSVYRTGSSTGSLTWPMFRNNLKRTGTYDDSVPPTVGGSFAVANSGFTKLRINADGVDAESGISGFDVDIREDAMPYVRALNRTGGTGAPGATVSTGYDLFGVPGRSYTARVRSWDKAGNRSAWNVLGTIALSAGASRSQPFRSAYAGSVYGPVSAISSPPVVGPQFSLPLARGVAAAPGGGGYELDAYGGIHAFGGAPNLTTNAYWPGWDITRGIALDPAGAGGVVLDGFGGLHGFGSTVSPPAGGYWVGWDIARGVVLTTDSTPARPRGYVLDAYGGLHAFGGAPRMHGGGYWPGWEAVRGIALDPAGPGGYVLDLFGGLHAFGGAPRRAIGGYWRGLDITRGVAMIGGGAAGRGYVLDGAGAIWPFGGAPPVQAQTYWGAIVGRGLSIAP